MYNIFYLYIYKGTNVNEKLVIFAKKNKYF